MTPDELTTVMRELASAGLVARSCETDAMIVGGTTSLDVFGIELFKDSFSISFENCRWIVRLPGDGQLVEEREAPDIESAIKEVVGFLLNATRQRAGFRIPAWRSGRTMLIEIASGTMFCNVRQKVRSASVDV